MISPTTLLLTSRDVVPADGSFQRRLFDADRGAQLTDSGLPADLVTQLLDHQYAGFTQMLADRATNSEVWLSDDEPVALLHFTNGPARTEVVWIAVSPERRRSGVAREVLSALLARTDAAGVDVALQVDPLNAGALALYGSLGFGAEEASPGDADLTLTRPAQPDLASHRRRPASTHDTPVASATPSPRSQP
jgi:ribosomal protein S18 acetylase RimI-like enzyme